MTRLGGNQVWRWLNTSSLGLSLIWPPTAPTSSSRSLLPRLYKLDLHVVQVTWNGPHQFCRSQTLHPGMRNELVGVRWVLSHLHSRYLGPITGSARQVYSITWHDCVKQTLEVLSVARKQNMATISKNFLDVDDAYPFDRKPRSHSSGHVDRIEEQERLERRDRDRRMREYHDSTRKIPALHHRTRSDHLEIPIYETNQRLRSNGGNDQQLKESPQSPQSPRNYRVEEFKPSPQLYDYDLDPETPLSSQLQRPLRGRTSRPDKAKAKVPPIIIQRTSTLPTDATSPSLKKSPGASPHSPTAQPVLQVQYAKLQHILTQTSDSCEKYLDVEPANPQDLTFTKIRETVEGFAEDLHIWSHVANLDGLARIDRNLRHLVDAASDVLDRLLDRATELCETCTNAKPKDLKMPNLNDGGGNDDVELYDDGDDDR